ncbi:unnamed protein product, partial [Didymodactylos carnosus]
KVPLDVLFSFEFSPVPFSLCDNQYMDLMNQQKKSSVVDYLRQLYPSAFSSIDPTTANSKIFGMIIDGGSLLQTKPSSTNCTVYNYAKQLLKNVIIKQFNRYTRIDIVFDSPDSKNVKSFTQRHGNDENNIQNRYDLKMDDILETNHNHFIHNNRAVLAKCVRECWSQLELMKLLPQDKTLIVAGPDEDTIKLQQELLSPQIEEQLKSDHFEADTRMFLHLYDISVDDENMNGGRFCGIIIQATDTDVLLLSIAHSPTIPNVDIFLKSFNTYTKTITFINVKLIANKLKQQQIEPNILLVLHAISAVTQRRLLKILQRRHFFMHILQLQKKPLLAAEQLLLSCYLKNGIRCRRSSSCAPKTTATEERSTLNQLRKTTAIKGIKQTKQQIAGDLPPTSDAFNLHCFRAWKQVYTWKQAFETFINQLPLEDFGYENVDGRTRIKWITGAQQPSDPSLSTCACTSGCKKRCKCGSNGVKCTIFCKCVLEICQNRLPHDITQSNLILGMDDEDDDDFNSLIKNDDEADDSMQEEEEEFIQNMYKNEGERDDDDNYVGDPYSTQLQQTTANYSIQVPGQFSSLSSDHDYYALPRSLSLSNINDSFTTTLYCSSTTNLMPPPLSVTGSNTSFTNLSDINIENTPSRSSKKPVTASRRKSMSIICRSTQKAAGIGQTGQRSSVTKRKMVKARNDENSSPISTPTQIIPVKRLYIRKKTSNSTQNAGSSDIDKKLPVKRKNYKHCDVLADLGNNSEEQVHW